MTTDQTVRASASPIGGVLVDDRKGSRAPAGLDVSVIVPVSERPDPPGDLYREYAKPLRAAGLSFEFVFVFEPWNREFVPLLDGLIEAGEPIRVLEVGQTFGESSLFRAGVTEARGRILISLPAYRRVAATVLPELVRRVESGVDLVMARRWPRRDSWLNRLQGGCFRWLLGRVGGQCIHDLGCGVRAIPAAVLSEIPLYGDFFRFLPLLALREGFRVEEVESEQHPADLHTRLYSPGTYARRLVDLLGMFFLLRFTYKPLRFFGLIGTTLGAIGGGILGVLFVQRIGGRGIADRPMLLLGVLTFSLGVQAVALGLIGEIIVHFNAPKRSPYRLDPRTALEEQEGET